MLIASIVALILLVIAFNVLSKPTKDDDDDQPEISYEDALKATEESKLTCAKTIWSNETKESWLFAMQAAFNLDQKGAEAKLVSAKEEFKQGNLHAALSALQKAYNWYNAYNARLNIIYGLTEGPAPEVPVITD